MLLKQYEIKASFFVVEEFARKNPMLIERMKEEGHLVGLHSVRHENALFRGRKFVHRDLEQSIAAMEKMGGDPCYYRPPWGHLNLWTLYYCRQRNLKLTFLLRCLCLDSEIWAFPLHGVIFFIVVCFEGDCVVPPNYKVSL